MNRSISLSEHHARRRKRRDTDGGSHSSSPDSSVANDSYGVAHDAACLGAYELPRSGVLSSSALNQLFDGDHESCIVDYHSMGSGGGQRPPQAAQRERVISPRSSFSSPEMDMEGQSADYYHVRRYDEGVAGYGNRSVASGVTGESYTTVASDESFVSVDVGGRGDTSTIATTSMVDEGMHSPSREEYDAIRAGIVDISQFVATYLAGGLSFVVGIFLAILSPFIKIIKIIFGDLTGLIGDAFGLALRNNPGLCRDLEGLTRIFKSFSSPPRYRRRDSDENIRGHYYQHPGGDCEASIGGESLYSSFVGGGSGYTQASQYSDDSTQYNHEASPQFVGGWSPSVASHGSRSQGSESTGLLHTSPMHHRPSVQRHSTNGRCSAPGNGWMSSKSYSSLPQVNEDDVSSCPPKYSPYYPEDDVSVGTSLSATSYRDSHRLMQRPRAVGSGTVRGSRRGSCHFP